MVSNFNSIVYFILINIIIPQFYTISIFYLKNSTNLAEFIGKGCFVSEPELFLKPYAIVFARTMFCQVILLPDVFDER